ncbi:MAG: S46 family peptidase, partial [Bacteroidetes bacterium]|nr:S46 family peptidase [Bacteroidota bacterium]
MKISAIAAKLFFILVALLFLASGIYSQSIYEPRDLSKVKWSPSDFGTMWTFDNVPVDRFEKEYRFRPTQEWLDDVRLSALQFMNGCSAAFVSADGLIMTNHHCGRGWLHGLSPKGEDYLRDGFYAKTMSEEIKVPNAYVDQLIAIEDVTKEVLDAMQAGKDSNEKIMLRNDKIKELQEKYSKETGLVCNVVELYNGNKFSMYEYRRYSDLRLVMAPDFQIASTGWDWDNFTYPRYELDFMFFRAYENNKPVESEHFFKWSKNGAKEGEPIFVIGRPGSTQRLISVAQMEFLKDHEYNHFLAFYNELYKVYFELFQTVTDPAQHSELLNMVMGVGNAR